MVIKSDTPCHEGIVVTKYLEEVDVVETVEELMQKAMKQLTVERDYSPEAAMFRGIGYAILALVTLTKEKKEGGNTS